MEFEKFKSLKYVKTAFAVLVLQIDVQEMLFRVYWIYNLQGPFFQWNDMWN